MKITWVLNLKTPGFPGISRILGFPRTNPEPQLGFVRDSTACKNEPYVASFNAHEIKIPKNLMIIPYRFENICTKITLRCGTGLFQET